MNKFSTLSALLFWLLCGSAAPNAAVPPAVDFGPVFGTEGENRFIRPLWFGENPGAPGSYFVLEQHSGRIYMLTGNAAGHRKTEFYRADVQTGGETGLLGFAFHPQFTVNRKYYINYTPAAGPVRTRIEERTVSPDFRSDGGTTKIILEVSQPEGNHNGGDLQFGPDGYLYIALGDGGGGGDDHGSIGNAQDLTTILGSLLRIDVDNPNGGREYGIPADNPFINHANPEVKKEIWAYGLRNVWRFSFDPLTGDLWAGDVGQNSREEISIIRAGENLGWRLMEGFACYNPGSGCENGGLVPPVVDFSRSQAQSITGGFVYRGDPASPYYGTYITADYVTWNLFGISQTDRVMADMVNWGAAPGNVSSFGRDLSGNIYMTVFNGGIYKFNLSENTAKTGLSGSAGRSVLAARQGRTLTFKTSSPFRTLDIRDVSGHLMNILKIQNGAAEWDTRDFSGYILEAGVYFAVFSRGQTTQVVKFVLQ